MHTSQIFINCYLNSQFDYDSSSSLFYNRSNLFLTLSMILILNSVGMPFYYLDSNHLFEILAYTTYIAIITTRFPTALLHDNLGASAPYFGLYVISFLISNLFPTLYFDLCTFPWDAAESRR